MVPLVVEGTALLWWGLIGYDRTVAIIPWTERECRRWIELANWYPRHSESRVAVL